MKAKTKHLKRLCQSREMVSIDRKAIDSASLHGFVLGHSDKLVCLLVIDDFRVEGLSVIRRKDITKLKTSDTNRLHKQMLDDDGVFESIDFTNCPPLSSWHDFFESIPDEDILIVEAEASKDSIFFIGRILSAETKLVAGHYFNGLGEWDEDPWEIEYKKITRCQLQSSYSSAYARHFARLEKADTG